MHKKPKVTFFSSKKFANRIMTNHNNKKWKTPKYSKNGKNIMPLMQIMVFKLYLKNHQFTLQGCVTALIEVAIITCFDHNSDKKSFKIKRRKKKSFGKDIFLICFYWINRIFFNNLAVEKCTYYLHRRDLPVFRPVDSLQ